MKEKTSSLVNSLKAQKEQTRGRSRYSASHRFIHITKCECIRCKRITLCHSNKILCFLRKTKTEEEPSDQPSLRSKSISTIRNVRIVWDLQPSLYSNSQLPVCQEKQKLMGRRIRRTFVCSLLSLKVNENQRQDLKEAMHLDYSSVAEKRGQFDKWTLKFGAQL